jgi:hypothetical protein
MNRISSVSSAIRITWSGGEIITGTRPCPVLDCIYDPVGGVPSDTHHGAPGHEYVPGKGMEGFS